jgi:hypothetical protein
VAEVPLSKNPGRFFHWELEFPRSSAGNTGIRCGYREPALGQVKSPTARNFTAVRMFSSGVCRWELDARIKELNAADLTLATSFEEYARNKKITGLPEEGRRLSER